MFTGIITDLGIITDCKEIDGGWDATVTASRNLGLHIGDSIALDGVCLTVRDIKDTQFQVQIGPETRALTTFTTLQSGRDVNLEPALGQGDKLGGHLVSGHVDGLARVTNTWEEGEFLHLHVSPLDTNPAIDTETGCGERPSASDLLQEIVTKGSVALNGVSLTVNKIWDDGFEVCLITHTRAHTNLGNVHTGQILNMETDVLGKYIRRYLSTHKTPDSHPSITPQQSPTYPHNTHTATPTGEASYTNSVTRAIEAIRHGGLVVVADDENRENEGDLICWADQVPAENVAFMASEGRGLICLPLPADLARYLDFPPQVTHNQDNHDTAFTVSIDALDTTTGISASERAKTASLVAHIGHQLATTPTLISDTELRTQQASLFRRPGHLFPLVARDGGVLERGGHTEATVDLCRLAGGSGVGLCCEMMGADGTMLRGEELRQFAHHHGLPFLTIAQLQEYRRRREAAVQCVSQAELPSKYGHVTISVWQQDSAGPEYVVLSKGLDAEGIRTQASQHTPVYVRLHSQCLTGDALGSLRCDCGDQLALALSEIQRRPQGLLMYLPQEGRGIGIGAKVAAYALQQKGMDTVDANLALGYSADARSYETAARILQELGLSQVELATNNPDKIAQLESFGITVTRRVPLEVPATEYDDAYLHTKAERMGHLLHL